MNDYVPGGLLNLNAGLSAIPPSRPKESLSMVYTSLTNSERGSLF